MNWESEAMQGQLFNSETKSQEMAILEHLKSGRAITPIDALNLYRCFRLGARVFSLKKQGFQIESEMIRVPSGKRVASYRLVTQ
jgi:hypothetical protein